MPKYNVYVYAVATIKCVNVEADSHEDAIRKADNDLPYRTLLKKDRPQPDGVDIEIEYIDYADVNEGYLVDVVGDEEGRESKEYQDGCLLAQFKNGIKNGLPVFDWGGKATGTTATPTPSFPPEESRGTIAGLPIEPAYSEADARDDDVRELLAVLVRAIDASGNPGKDHDWISEAAKLVERYQESGLLQHTGVECAECGEFITDEISGQSTPNGSMHTHCAQEHHDRHPDQW